jgi:hypothetical protein
VAQPAYDREDPGILMGNLGFANTYRLELNKQIVAISTALFAFTVAFFTPNSVSAHAAQMTAALRWLAWAGWTFLGLAIFSGLAQMELWERFYMTYRDYDNRGQKDVGIAKRRPLTICRRVAKGVQYFAFAVGGCCIGVFAALRLAA